MQGSEVQGLGQLLQQARERKGVTLTEAQQATKIRYSFLQAIEKEDFSILPPRVYARGFIKTYAAYLELDPNAVVQAYDEIMDGFVVAYPVQMPSADSGGQNLPAALRGITQGEMRTIEPGDMRFQAKYIGDSGPENPEKPNANPLMAVPAARQPLNLAPVVGQAQPTANPVLENPTTNPPLVSPVLTTPPASKPFSSVPVTNPTGVNPFLSRNNTNTPINPLISTPITNQGLNGHGPATIPASRAIVPVFQRKQEITLVPNPNKIVLPSVMLKDTKGAFYIPNFAPMLFVVVIILAAFLLLYRGITSQNPDTPTPEQAALAATQTSGLGTAKFSNTTVAITTTRAPMTPPPSQPVATTAAVSGQQPAPAPTRAIGQGGIPVTTAPSAETIQAAPTPVPASVKVEVLIGTSDSRGSWLTVWVDDQQVLARIVPPGEKLAYEGKKVAVRAGNPGVITLKVNGADREYTKPGTGVITRTIYADGRPDSVEN